MATRGTIGYETKEGGYVGVYLHYDAYPENVAPFLESMTYDNVVEMVLIGLAENGLRQVDCGGRRGYETFADNGPMRPNLEWPKCPEEWAYRKRLDGEVEICMWNDLTPFIRGGPSRG